MRLIELDRAIEQIKRACMQVRRPFFFIVGAGVSNPPIPLASNIETECRTLALDYDSVDESQGMSAIDRYSYWFDRAYEQPVLRQQYLRNLIEGTPISHANFRLAHLLLEKGVSNIVVTPNFDDFLSRALRLFGKPHIVCDHPKTVERINPEQDDIQILHVHGTYWFYDCCNLKDEIATRAKTSEYSNETMAFKLDDILSRRSPLVIGYSGWEGDVIMSALKRRLQSDLPYNLYWFCYTHDSIKALPDWLKFHPRVYLVTPRPASSVKDASEGAEGESTHIIEAERLNKKALELANKFKSLGQDASGETLQSSPKTETADYLGRKQEEQRLGAEQVFDKLIQAFDLKAPLLTSDPLSFFAAYLEDLLPKEDLEKARGNIYSFGSVVARIERAKQNEIVQFNEVELEKVRDALRRSQYREAIQQGVTISLKDLDQRQLGELMTAMFTATSTLQGKSEDEIAGYDLVVTIGDALSQRGVEKDSLNEQVAKALMNKAYRFGDFHQHEEAIAACDQLMSRFGKTKEPGLREQVAKALVSKGYNIGKLNRSEEAIIQCDRFLEEFGAATESRVVQLKAVAMGNKAIYLASLKKHEEALAECDKVIELFAAVSDPFLLQQVGKALANKGYWLHELGRYEEAILMWNELPQRFGESGELALRELVATAVVHKSYELRALGRTKELVATLQEAINRFRDAKEPILRAWVGRAFNSWGFTKLLDAKEAWASGDEEAGRIELADAHGKIDASLEYDNKNAVALGNKGYILFLLGNEEEARDILAQAIGLGGEKIRQGELDDSRISPLPQDELFRQLILSITLPNNISDGEGT